MRLMKEPYHLLDIAMPSLISVTFPEAYSMKSLCQPVISINFITYREKEYLSFPPSYLRMTKPPAPLSLPEGRNSSAIRLLIISSKLLSA